jgi:hypothetical protein
VADIEITRTRGRVPLIIALVLLALVLAVAALAMRSSSEPGLGGGNSAVDNPLDHQPPELRQYAASPPSPLLVEGMLHAQS